MFVKALTIVAYLLAVCAAPGCSAYPQNLLSKGLGAFVSTSARLESGSDVSSLLSDGPVSTGGFHFAKVAQDQVFVVDLGSVRTFDRVQFGSGNWGQDRCAQRV